MATKRKTTSDAARLKRARTKLQARLQKAVDHAVKSPGLEQVFMNQTVDAKHVWHKVNDPRDATELYEAEQAAIRARMLELAPGAVVSSDVELQSMTICVNALDGLTDIDARKRVAGYLFERYVTDRSRDGENWGDAGTS